jgi:hypothetical protein
MNAAELPGAQVGSSLRHVPKGRRVELPVQFVARRPHVAQFDAVLRLGIAVPAKAVELVG